MRPAALLRANVVAMEPYVPGEQPPPGAKLIKLNTNENPYPPSPRVAEAIAGEVAQGRAAGDHLRLYSDPAATLLRQAASEVTGVGLDGILHGNGSDELLSLLVRAVVGEGELIAFPYPTYILYQTLAQAQGARVEIVDCGRNFDLPPALFETRAKLVFVASPNPPSGRRYPTALLEKLARGLPHAVVAIDEAYAAFADENALELVGKLPNVVVLRTFSKSHSLAGMRLGLLFGHPELVRGLWKIKDSYNLDRLAIVAGAASLRDQAWTANNVERIRATRQRLRDGLLAFGLEVPPSEANFLFARFGSAEAARSAFQGLRAAGLLVRYFPSRMLDDGIRISVGTDEEADALLAALSTHLTATDRA